MQKKLMNSIKDEGFSKGEKSKQLEIANKMLNDKVDKKIIIKYTGLSIDEINNIII